METLVGIVFIVLAGVSITFLVAVTVLPPQRHIKIKAKSTTPLEFPQTCVITGEPATEQHSIRVYRVANPVMIEWRQFRLPFTPNGWAEYCKEFPVSLRIFKTGLDVLMWIPMLGAFLAIYVWIPWGGAICGLFAMRDFWQVRRQLVKFNEISARHGALHEVDMDVVNESFAEEFRRVNANATFAPGLKERGELLYEGPVRSVLFDTGHGRGLDYWSRFRAYVSARRKVGFHGKRRLTGESLAVTDALVLIGPDKSWDDDEIAAVRDYVHGGGILVVATEGTSKAEHVNRLLEPYGISIGTSEVSEENLTRDTLYSESLDLDDIGTLSAGHLFNLVSTTLSTTRGAEILLALAEPNAPLVVRRAFGSGSVLVLSCLPIFGNKQMESPGNITFLNRLLEFF